MEIDRINAPEELASTRLPTPIVHDAVASVSSAHVPSYFALAFASGAVNAGAFLACERFVSHVTGTVTRIGLDISAPTLMVEYATVTLAFVLGAMASVVALDVRAMRRLEPRPDWVLGAVVAMLVGISVAGGLGFFGPFGGAVEETADFALLVALSLTMGAMNAAVASSTALAIRTTHMTGPATDLGVQLGRALVAAGTERIRALRLAGIRGGKIVAFVGGAAVTTACAPTLSHFVFLLPALVVSAATARSFLPTAELIAPPSARTVPS